MTDKGPLVQVVLTKFRAESGKELFKLALMSPTEVLWTGEFESHNLTRRAIESAMPELAIPERGGFTA